MFKRNDYALLAARILLICGLIIGIILCPIVSIWLAVKIHWAYFFIILPMLFSVCVYWIIGRLILSFFCDVKLIRNKLYDESNEKLEVFIKPKSKIVNACEKQEDSENSNLDTTSTQNSLINEEDSTSVSESDNLKESKENDETSKKPITKVHIISVLAAILLSVLAVVAVILSRIL